MKKRILTLLLLLSLVIGCLASCNLFGGKEEGPEKEEEKNETVENLIYDATSELYFIVAPGVVEE